MPLFLLWVSFAVSKANLQEKDTDSEVDDIFWNTRIVPILHELEKGKKKQNSFCFKSKVSMVIYMSPISLIFLVHFDYDFCEHVQKQVKPSTIYLFT